MPHPFRHGGVLGRALAQDYPAELASPLGRGLFAGQTF